MQVYVDTVERSYLRDGHGTPATRYVVRLMATRSRPGRILAQFDTLAAAEWYAANATDPRWALVQTT